MFLLNDFLYRTHVILSADVHQQCSRSASVVRSKLIGKVTEGHRQIKRASENRENAL